MEGQLSSKEFIGVRIPLEPQTHFMSDRVDSIKQKIKYSHYHKFDNLAPEGFVLITETAFEKLKDFDFWKEWKYNPKILIDFMKEELK